MWISSATTGVASANVMTRLLIPFAASVMVGLCVMKPLCAQSLTHLGVFPMSSLTIDARGKVHKFQVELALNPRQHAQGLMFRRRLAPNKGMMFVYKNSGAIAMWMKNTLIPLDIIFIKIGGLITRIVKRTVPMSETKILSVGPVIAVLELNAGMTDRLDIRVGDLVRSPVLQDDP